LEEEVVFQLEVGEAVQLEFSVVEVDPAGTAEDFEARGDVVVQAGEELGGEDPVIIGAVAKRRASGEIDTGHAETAAKVGVEVSGEVALEFDVSGDRDDLEIEGRRVPGESQAFHGCFILIEGVGIPGVWDEPLTVRGVAF